MSNHCLPPARVRSRAALALILAVAFDSSGACSRAGGGSTGGGGEGAGVMPGSGGQGGGSAGNSNGKGGGAGAADGATRDAGGSVAPPTGAAGATASGGTGGFAGAAAAGGGGGTGATIPILNVGCGMLKIEVCTANVIRVACAPNAAFFTRASLATAPKQCVATPTQVSSGAGQMTITTSALSVRVDTTSGAVTFLDPTGETVLAEQPGGGRTLTAATVQGESTYNVRQEWQPQADESLYGLGQHQQGHFDIKGYDLDLHQQNTEVFIPYLVSSRGYGILWDNTSYTRFGDLSLPVQIPGVSYVANDPNNTVTGASTGAVNWQGTVTAPTTGDYEFFTYASGNLQLGINNQTMVNHWRQGWLPNVEMSPCRPVRRSRCTCSGRATSG